MARLYSGLDVQGDLGGLFPWKSNMVDVGGGVHQAVVDEGPRDAPLTFLLLHGNPTWGLLYRKFILRLAERHRVVVPDHVGFGRSDKPRDPGYYTLERHIANLGTTLAALDVRDAVPVVQDWGGPIGMGWATRQPERVKGVVILNTWAFVREPAMKLPWWFKLMVLGRGGQRRVKEKNIFVESFLARMMVRAPLEPAVLDGYRAAHPEPADREGIAAFPRMIPQSHDTEHPSWRTMAAIEDALPSLGDKPALIVWSKGDPGFRKVHLERWRGIFPHAEGPHFVEGKHYLQEDAPDDIVRRILDWAPRAAKG